MAICKMCQSRGLKWNLGNFICAFSSEDFSKNWNCATIDAIRKISNDIQECGNQKYIIINISDIKLNNKQIGLSLWFTWLKHSGTINKMYILSEKENPRIPREDELLEIVKYFENK